MPDTSRFAWRRAKVHTSVTWAGRWRRRAVPLADKKRILDEYVDLIWGTPGIQSSTIGYGDAYRKTVFATSEGAYIEHEKVDVTLRLSAMARDGGDVQQAGVSLGSRGDFSFVETLHDEVRELAHRAVELLKAPQVKGGEYTVVLDPILAGVFIHEAFGHLSEADHVYESDRLKEIMVLGRRFGGPHLNVVDGGAISGLRGSYKYDDEGTPATRTDLIREGVLVGRLHSRETAAKMGELPTGNARAIVVGQGDTPYEDMIADVKDGIVVESLLGAGQGNTLAGDFNANVLLGYRIDHGKLVGRVKNTVISGNVYHALSSLAAVGREARWLGGSIQTPALYCHGISVAAKA